jgi:drug/metabolite transporter (DMT)-like permease
MPAADRRAPLAVAAMLVASGIWGFSYLCTVWVLAEASTASFLAVRFLGAGLLLLALRPRALRALTRRDLIAGAGLGALLAAGLGLQVEGLRHISPAVSGFVTTLYVVLTPLIGWAVLRRRVAPAGWLGALTATGGLALLTLHGLAIDAGVALTLAGAVAYSCHLILLSEVSTHDRALGLTVIQLLVVGALGSAWAAAEGVRLPHTAGAWGWVLFCALAATLLGYLLQTWAQGHVTADRAAVVFATEPLFVAAFAALAGDRLGGRDIAGGLLIVAAVTVASTPRLPALLHPRLRRPRPRQPRDLGVMVPGLTHLEPFPAHQNSKIAAEESGGGT